MADKSVQILLLMDALKNTNRENPKTSKRLIQDVQAAWEEIFPGEPPATLSPATIGRHIKAMNKSGLYHIATCKNAKEGYYCDSFPFESAEFALIAQALYRSVAISTKETNNILNKFFNHTDDLGEGYLNIMLKQLRRTAPRRKPERETLPIIRSILAAVWNQRQLRFTYYEKNDRDVSEMEMRTDENTGEPVVYKVSPYYLVWNADECYLIAHYPGHDKDGVKRLSHFKVSLISRKILVMEEPTCSITEMQEYPRYCMRRTTPEYVAVVKRKEAANLTKEQAKSIDRRAALVQFSLDRYMRENVFMFHDDSPVVDVRLYFKENFAQILMEQFNLDRNTIKLYPTGRTFPNGEPIISAIITVQANGGFYMWLMQQGNKVTVAEPESVRQKLKQKYLDALSAIEEYEQGPKDPINKEQLAKDRKDMERVEMFREMGIPMGRRR